MYIYIVRIVSLECVFEMCVQNMFIEFVSRMSVHNNGIGMCTIVLNHYK